MPRGLIAKMDRNNSKSVLRATFQWLTRNVIRTAIFFMVFFGLLLLWLFEQSIETDRVLGGLCLLTTAPFFLMWFFGFELRRESISHRTFIVPTGILFAMLFAARCDHTIDFVRRGGGRFEISSGLQQIALAMESYQAKSGTFPPAVLRDKNGKPLHSWRVLLLPYLGENELYSDFHLNEPWDSPHNMALVNRMPRDYAGPKEIAVSGGRTFFQVIVGPGAAFEGDRGFKSPLDFPDGIQSTILVVEARNPVVWTQPVDLQYVPDGALPEFGALRRKTVPEDFMAVMVNGRTRAFKTDISAALLRPWITRNARDKVGEVD